MALLLNACESMHKIQKAQYRSPMLGSIGKHQSGLFKKNFQKVGEPYLNRPITVAFESIAFTKRMKSRYTMYREYMGKQPSTIFTDTSKTKPPRYYKLTISNIVSLVEELNQDRNIGLKQYLKEDIDLDLLSQISFMTNKKMAEEMRYAEQLYLKTDNNGILTLYIGDRRKQRIIKLSALEIFDFETAAFCWQKDKRGQLDIAHILMDGGNCPGNTEANPEKLNKTPDYLKL